MKGIVIKKGNLGEFVKSHKKEIITGAIAIAVIGGLVYISYKSGFKAGVKANTIIPNTPCEVSGFISGDNYVLSLVGSTYGCGQINHGVMWSQTDAADMAMGILKDLGYLKEVVEVPGEIAKEVVANG